MKSAVAWPLVGATTLFISGCATTQPQLPLDPTHAASTGAQVAHLSVVSKAIHYEDVVDALGEFQFRYDQAWLIANGSLTTSSNDASRVDSLTATLTGILAGRTVNKSNTVATANGVTSTSSSDVHSLITPQAPSAGQTFVFQAPAMSTTPPVGSVGVDGETQIRQAAALAEIIAIENNRVKSLDIPAGYRAYFVNFQVQIAPLEHGLPYDTKLTLQFERAGIDNKPVFVMPLLANDVDEESKYTEVSSLLRQYGAQLQASGGIFGGSANLQRVIESLENSASTRPNSLYSIGVEPKEDGGMATAAWVKMGANHFGATYEMVTRTHNVAVVVFVPLSAVEDDGRTPSVDRLIKYRANFVYSDALPATTDHKRFPDLQGQTIAGRILVPTVLVASCPKPQDAVLTWASLQQSQSITNVNNPSVAVVTLQGGRGYAWRKLEATLTTPKDLIGGPLTLRALDARPTATGVQFTFPGHQDGLKATKEPQALYGKLEFEFQDTRDGLTGWRCAAPSYRVAYFVAPNVPKPADPKLTEKPEEKANATSAVAAASPSTPPANPPVVLTPHVLGPS